MASSSRRVEGPNWVRNSGATSTSSARARCAEPAARSVAHEALDEVRRVPLTPDRAAPLTPAGTLGSRALREGTASSEELVTGVDEAESTPGLLILPQSVADDPDVTTPRLGRPFDRRSPFFMGLVGGLGLALAYAIARGIADLGAVLAIIGLAMFIAIGLNPIVTVLENHRTPRWLAVALVAAGFVGVFGGFFWAAGPVTAHEVGLLVKNYPKFRTELLDGRGWLGRLTKTLHLTAYLRAHQKLHIPIGGILGAGKALLSFAVATVSICVLTVYFLAALPGISALWTSLFPRTRRARIEYLTEEVFARVGGFMLGNLLTSFVAGIGTYFWMLGFGLPYPLLLAVFVAIADLIPVVGSTVGGIVVALVALTHGLPTAIATGAFYACYRLLEDYLLNPHVMKLTVSVSAGLTIVAVLIGGALFGLLGALVAVPVAATVRLLLSEVVTARQEQR